MSEKKTKKTKKSTDDVEKLAKIKTLEHKIMVNEAIAKKKEKEVKVLPKETKVDFESWYHARAAKIPRQHMKEILKADFKARKLGDYETAEDYDKALEQYGVKLN